MSGVAGAWRGAAARIGAVRRDERGIALIEFAMVLPTLILLYLAGFVFADEIARSRKVTIATRALADMAAQSATGTTSVSEIANELAATTQVMTPYSSTPLTLRLTEVYTDLTGTTTVQWSQAYQGTPYSKGAPYTIPLTLRIAGTYLLVSEASYAYVPPISYAMATAHTMSDQIIMLPRNTSSISCGDC